MVDDSYTSNAFPAQTAPTLPSDLKYLDPADWPVGESDVFHSFDDDDLARAAHEAERRLEADVNGGKVIESPGQLHSLAVSYFTTFRLARTAKHPASQYRGEVAGDPDGKASYANSLKEDYLDLVERIEQTDEDDVGHVGGSHRVTVERV